MVYLHPPWSGSWSTGAGLPWACGDSRWPNRHCKS